MKGKEIFKIKDLACSYNGKDDVLIVNELNISEGQIVVLLGISGAGKSTILETLGLMSNTIKNGSKVTFCPDEKEYRFNQLWTHKNHDEMSAIRRKHFSFIFQNTNLMPNFTAYENISITQMIEGIPKEEAINNARSLAKSLGLEISEKKKAFEMSGGEKQRAAFIRAISPDFTVLFGDEPTGNLDRKNAHMLLSILRKTIKEKKKTAIIVSHDISMALEFADTIIVLKKGNGNVRKKDYSIITNETTFQSVDNHKCKIWKNHLDEDITSSIENHIENIITN